MSNPYLSQIERGLRTPSAEILQQIARALRISAEALYVRAGILDQRPAGAVTDAVLADPHLTERQKQVLLDVYQSFRRELTGADASGVNDGLLRTRTRRRPHGRHRARRTATTEEHRPTPLLAVLGAGDAAVAAVARAFADAYAAAASRRETVQHRVAELPTELEGLRARFSGDELRRALETYRAQVERAYAQFAGRGEETWGKLREKPQVRQAMTTSRRTPRSSTPASTTPRRRRAGRWRREQAEPGRGGEGGPGRAAPVRQGRRRGRRRERGDVGRRRGRGHRGGPGDRGRGGRGRDGHAEGHGIGGLGRGSKTAPRSTTPRSAVRRPSSE